jgi:hypothetical protein
MFLQYFGCQVLGYDENKYVDWLETVCERKPQFSKAIAKALAESLRRPGFS